MFSLPDEEIKVIKTHRELIVGQTRNYHGRSEEGTR
jgi:hypothetical protein